MARVANSADFSRPLFSAFGKIALGGAFLDVEIGGFCAAAADGVTQQHE